MLRHARTVDTTVEVTVWVHRDTNTGLADEARDALAATDAVESVESASLEGVQPGATDVEVSLVADLAVRTEETDADAVEEAVGDGVRVTDAEVVRLGRG